LTIVDDTTRLDSVCGRPDLRRVRWRPNRTHRWIVVGYVLRTSSSWWQHSEGRGLVGLIPQGPARLGPEIAARDLVAKVVADREGGPRRASRDAA